MLTKDLINQCTKDNLSTLSQSLESADIAQLVDWLSEKDDNFRYACLCILRSRSFSSNDVYPHWEKFVEKLSSTNSYQRSIGLMLIADNVRWDNLGKFDEIADQFLTLCDDEKPITARQCIQHLQNIIPYNQNSLDKIYNKLISIDLSQRKETQQSLLRTDINTALSLIQKTQIETKH